MNSLCKNSPRRIGSYQRYRDHSMESVRERFLFTDCDALEKKIQKKTTAGKKRINWVQRTIEFFFMHSNEWIKVVQALSKVYCFYFIHTEIFPCWTTCFKDWKPLRANVVMNTNRRLVKRGLVKRGLVKRGLVKQGLVNHFCFCRLRHCKFGFN